MNKQKRKDRATQLLICETLSLAIIFWGILITSLRNADQRYRTKSDRYDTSGSSFHFQDSYPEHDGGEEEEGEALG